MVALGRALPPAVSIYAPDVLAAIGESDLAQQILDRFEQVQWAILMSKLEECIPRDTYFNPGTIQSHNQDLHKALTGVLGNGNGNGDAQADWNKLSEHLPEKLRRWYEPVKQSKEQRRERIEAETRAKIESDEEIQHALTMFNGDRKKLAFALRSLGLSSVEVADIIFVRFHGLKQDPSEARLDFLIRTHQPTISGRAEVISECPTETNTHEIELTVRMPAGSSRLCVEGTWKKDIIVKEGEDTMVIRMPLTPGKMNFISLLPYHEDKNADPVLRTRCDQPTVVAIEQNGQGEDIAALFEFLTALKGDKLEALTGNEERSRNFLLRAEEFLIKHFAEDFKEGERYTKALIGQFKDNDLARKTLNAVLTKFRAIDKEKYPALKTGKKLYFFQKYCIYKIRQARENGARGVILANEPGLGKTVTALLATHDDEVLIGCPNAVASVWKGQEGYFFKAPFLMNLAGVKYDERQEMLRENAAQGQQAMPGVVTNIQFVRFKKGSSEVDAQRTDQKFALLNGRWAPHRRRRVNVVDEMHFLKNESQQTEGVRRLQGDFSLWLSASPHRDPDSFCRIMRHMLPGDRRFASLTAFRLAFPKDDPEALRVLNMLQQEHIIRFTKADVLLTSDPAIPVEQQKRRVPRKRHIEAENEQGGLFTLTEAQQQAIFELFEDWEAWKRKYDKYMPADRWAREDRIRGRENQLVKKHALRQIVNNPAYIGSPEASPKHAAMRRIIEQELGANPNNKGLVFCRYHAEVDAYAEMLRGMGIPYTLCTGRIIQEKYKKDDTGEEMYFEVDRFDNPKIGPDGKPIPTTDKNKGKRLMSIDYETQVFQNDPNTRIMLSTFEAGGVGKTFTAANFAVEDDKPEDYTARYQAEDRIHRIDEERPKHEVRYYSLTSQYSPEFLDGIRDMTLEEPPRSGEDVNVENDEPVTFSPYERWFAQGTMDSVQESNLQSQKTVFEIINDGIEEDPNLMRNERRFRI